MDELKNNQVVQLIMVCVLIYIQIGCGLSTLVLDYTFSRIVTNLQVKFYICFQQLCYVGKNRVFNRVALDNYHSKTFINPSYCYSCNMYHEVPTAYFITQSVQLQTSISSLRLSLKTIPSRERTLVSVL